MCMWMRHRGPCLQLFFLNIALRNGIKFNVSKGNVLIHFNIIIKEKSEKTT